MFKNFFFLIFFILISNNVFASTKISFIDITFLLEKSNAGMNITELLVKEREKETKKLMILQEKIKKKEEEFKSRSNILNDEEKNKIVQDLKKEVKNYNLLKAKKEKEFNIKKTKYINNLLKEINNIMISYIEKNSIDIVVKKENLVTGKKEYDITKIILDELNKKKITFKWYFMKLTKKEIINLLPHREPMLLIDELTNIKKLSSATAIMNVRKDKFYVDGHFPGQPVLPGVLIVEAFGQAAAALTAHGIDKETYENKLVYLMSVEKAKFRNPVIPDCKLELNIQAIRSHGRVWKYKGEAFVEGKKMADAQWSATIVDRK